MDFLTLTYLRGETQEFIPHTSHTRLWIKPDWLTHRFNFNVRVNGLTEKGKGTPCVFRVGQKNSAVPYNELSVNPIQLTEEWQFFAADLLAYQKYGVRYSQLPASSTFASLLIDLPVIGKRLALLDAYQRAYIESRFTALYDNNLAYCNGQGFNKPDDPRANFIKRQDMSAELPKMFALIDGTDSYTGTQDGDCVQLDSWLENQPPTGYDISILDDPRVAWCAVIRPTEIGGGYSVYQFPQLDGIPVPRPFVTKEPVYYWIDEVEIYSGNRRGLYWPERAGTP